jgi:hypothetical protein
MYYEFNSRGDEQPMEIGEHWRDVMSSAQNRSKVPVCSECTAVWLIGECIFIITSILSM